MMNNYFFQDVDKNNEHIFLFYLETSSKGFANCNYDGGMISLHRIESLRSTKVFQN